MPQAGLEVTSYYKKVVLRVGGEKKTSFWHLIAYTCLCLAARFSFPVCFDLFSCWREEEVSLMSCLKRLFEKTEEDEEKKLFCVS